MSKSGRRPPGLLALPFGLAVLLAGLWGGLARLGYQLPADSTSSAQHGVLMSIGFIGTLIAIERATALGRRWAWAVPAASVAGSVWLVAGGPHRVGNALLLLAGVGLVAVYARLDRIQRSTHNTLMGAAAIGWAVGAALLLGGRGIGSIVPWLALFLVVTITAERLELSRLLGTSRSARVQLISAVLLMTTGATISIWAHGVGISVCGAAMLALAAWLSHFDLARRTLRQTGVTRFMAIGLLTGYVWLALGGALWLWGGFHVGGASYDAQLHAVFLGFVMSMIFAHAPVIAPAVIRRPLPYSPAFYGPLVVLHVGLLLRVFAGDAAGWTLGWQLGGVIDEIAILGFVAVTATSIVRATLAEARKNASPASARFSSRAPAVGGAVIGVVVLVAAVLFANSGSHRSQGAVAHVDPSTAARGVEISLVDMRIVPSTITVPAGSHLVLHVTNNGSMRHDLKLANGVQTPMLDPGEDATLDAGVITKPLEGWCTVPGHRQAGMVMQIEVGPKSEPAQPSPTDGTNMAGMHMDGTHAAPSPSGPDAVSTDLAAAPPKGWTPIDAALPPVPNGTVHNVTWHIKNVTTTVAPGVTQLLWTFDGRVPGPVLHGRVGDTFNVTVVNDTDMAHNLDFHVEAGPPAKVMTPVPPGGTHVYSFVASHAGAWLYHCAVEPMLLHMGNGMYGALIVDPPGLRPAAAEYVLVGSEFFFGPQGQIGDYSKMLADKPDAVVFNGYPFAYQHAPLKAKAGELVRVWVVDAGPTRPIAFHVVGAPFTTTYLDGAYLLGPQGSADGAAQTLPVDPGDGGFVELTFSEPGSYPFLSHAMADAAIGAMGAFDVRP